MKRKQQRKEFRDLGLDELEKKVEEMSHELMNLRFRKASRQLTSVAQIKELRRSVARARTILRQRESRA